jgi:hypothetical protein
MISNAVNEQKKIANTATSMINIGKQNQILSNKIKNRIKKAVEDLKIDGDTFTGFSKD